MSRERRRRALALKVPACVVSRPFESFTALLGTFGSIPTVLRLDHSEHIYNGFPDWVPVAWALLTVVGALRTVYGLKVDSRIQISQGSMMVAWMILGFGLATISSSDGRSGWATATAGLFMIYISTARSLHMRAIGEELRKAT